MMDIFKPELELQLNQHVEKMRFLPEEGLTKDERREIVKEAKEDLDQIDVFIRSVP